VALAAALPPAALGGGGGGGGNGLGPASHLGAQPLRRGQVVKMGACSMQVTDLRLARAPPDHTFTTGRELSATATTGGRRERFAADGGARAAPVALRPSDCYPTARPD
jgi:hypothetical protein